MKKFEWLLKDKIFYSVDEGKFYDDFPLEKNNIKMIAYNKEKEAWKIVAKDGKKHFFKVFEKEVRPEVKPKRFEVRIPFTQKMMMALDKVYLFDTREEAQEFLQEVKKNWTLPRLPDDEEEIEVIDVWDEEIDWDYIEDSNREILEEIR